MTRGTLTYEETISYYHRMARAALARRPWIWLPCVQRACWYLDRAEQQLLRLTAHTAGTPKPWETDAERHTGNVNS